MIEEYLDIGVIDDNVLIRPPQSPDLLPRGPRPGIEFMKIGELLISRVVMLLMTTPPTRLVGTASRASHREIKDASTNSYVLEAAFDSVQTYSGGGRKVRLVSESLLYVPSSKVPS